MKRRALFRILLAGIHSTKKKVNGIQMGKFNLSKYYSKEQINVYVEKLKKERVKWLKRFENLNPAIVDAIRL